MVISAVSNTHRPLVYQPPAIYQPRLPAPIPYINGAPDQYTLGSATPSNNPSKTSVDIHA
jgi:hypothetical protein